MTANSSRTSRAVAAGGIIIKNIIIILLFILLFLYIIIIKRLDATKFKALRVKKNVNILQNGSNFKWADPFLIILKACKASNEILAK